MTSSLCVLGAGNLNDVRIDALCDGFGAVHLVDLDIDCVRAALRRRGLGNVANCRVHGPVDLTGVLQRLPGTHRADAGALCDIDRVLQRHRCSVPHCPFDVVVSAGVLTQLLQSVVDSALLPGHAVDVGLALRNKHLADLVALTRPVGALLQVPDGRLEDAMASLIAGKNFFTGTNPYRIVALLEEEPSLAEHVCDVEMLDPWLWAVTRDRQHLTTAIVAHRRPGHRSH